MPPATTYFIRFYDPAGRLDDEIEHTTFEDAVQHVNFFDESDSMFYSRIEVMAYTWKTRTEEIVYFRVF